MKIPFPDNPIVITQDDFCINCPEKIFWPYCDMNHPCPYYDPFLCTLFPDIEEEE
jgi:hypothetical protein